jgi:thioredoxin 1
MTVLDDKNFESEVLQSKIPVLVDFYADWCGPCQMAGPVLEELAKEYEEKVSFGKLNVDKSQPIAAKYAVMSIPTVILFKDGKEVGRQVGFPGKEGYIDLIKKVYGI